MKLRIAVSLCVLLLSSMALAQEQLAVRLNEAGLLKILQMTLKYNTSARNSRTFSVPQNIYKFTVPKSQLLSNPIVPLVNEISNLNLHQDLNFFVNTSAIRVTGVVSPGSLKTSISNSRPSGFDFKLSLNLSSVSVAVPSIALCEDKVRGQKKCGSGLKANVTNVRINTHGKPVSLTAAMRLTTSKGIARVKVLSVSSNLESAAAPSLEINFDGLHIPEIALVVNGQETVLDTSKLKGEVLARKQFLARKLMSFVGDFITNDLAEMINVYLVHKEVMTSWEVYRKDDGMTFDEFLSTRHDGQYPYRRPGIPANSPNPMAAMFAQIADIIHNAHLQLALSKISTPLNKDIELHGNVGFTLNGKAIQIQNNLGNSSRQLPPLDLNLQRRNDVNLAISEPLINGTLDLVNSTGLFQELFNRTGILGFTIHNVKAHFTNRQSIMMVANCAIDLHKIKSSSITEWVKNLIAAWLERNNNQSVIYFPIDIEVLPVIHAQPDGGVMLSLKLLTPFAGNGLRNTFHYPTNVPAMTDVVRKGVMAELQKNLNQYVNKIYNIDLSRFLNQSGVVFLPKAVAINQAAYLMLNLDIADINFSSLTPRGHK